MAWLIMNDLIDYPCEWYPTHVMTSDKDIIPVFLGAASTIEDKRAVGIYVREGDYDKLNHKKAYVFIHNPDAEKEQIEELEWDMIPDQLEGEEQSANRAHIHLWIEAEDIQMETIGES